MLARSADELLLHRASGARARALKDSAVTDVHMFARRGPAQAKFTPVELRELDHSPNVQVLVPPEGMEFDDESEAELARHKSLRMVVDVLCEWALRDPEPGPHRRIHLHFLETPVEILGTRRRRDGPAHGAATARRRRHRAAAPASSPTGTCRPCTGASATAPRRSTTCRSTRARLVLPNDAGRVLDLDGDRCPALYVTGWVKRGPVGLIGHTKSDAAETIANLLADADGLAGAPPRPHADLLALLADKGLPVTDFDGWDRLDAHELAVGEPVGRGRVKVVARTEMTRIAAAD